MPASEDDTEEQDGREAPTGLDLPALAAEAVDQLSDLLGRQPEGVTGVRREGDGWSVLVDVMELERIPASASVIATYRVDLDADGNLDGYERLRRYTRGATDPR